MAASTAPLAEQAPELPVPESAVDLDRQALDRSLAELWERGRTSEQGRGGT